MAKRKAGLHKNVSSIFNNVPAPNAKKKGSTENPTKNGTQDHSKVDGTPKDGSAPPKDPLKKIKPDPKPIPTKKTVPTEKPASPQPVMPEKPSSPSPVTPEKPAPTKTTHTPVKKPKSDRKPWKRPPKKTKNTWGIASKIFSKTKKEVFDKLTPAQRKRQKKMLILLPALSIALVVLILSKIKPTTETAKTDNETSERSGIKIKPIAKYMDTKIDWEIPDEYPKDIRDPMTAAWVRKGSQDGSPTMGIDGQVTAEGEEEPESKEQIYIDEVIVVNSILYGNPSSVVIDNEILYEGDSIRDVLIKRINKNSVLFEKDGVLFTKSIQL